VDAHAGNDFIYLFAQTPIAPTVHGGLGNDKIEMTDARVFDYPEDSGFNINFAALPGFVYGDAGDDVLIAGNSGNDFYGGDGFDKIDYSKVTWRYYSWDHYRWLVDVTSRGVTVSLDNQTNDGPRGLENAHSDIEELIGSPAGDLLTASAGPTTILGGTGNDMLVGDNNDSLDGGAGANTITMGQASLSNGLLKILGSDHDDLIIVRRKLNDTTNLEILFDRLMIAATFKLADVTFIQIDAKAGNDRIEFDQTNGPLVLRTKIYGGAGNDVIYGSAGADQIHGGDGNDWISAGDGNDNVYGEAGNDRLFGGDGNDYLDGGSGTDMIRGDGGIDRIVATMALDDYTKNRGDVLILSN
jgi:Ca2+-binding RTX toxin-like protein